MRIYVIITICTTITAPGHQVPVSVAGLHTREVVLTSVWAHLHHRLAVQLRPLLLHPVPALVLVNVFLVQLTILESCQLEVVAAGDVSQEEDGGDLGGGQLSRQHLLALGLQAYNLVKIGGLQ